MFVFAGFLAGMAVYVWRKYESRMPIGLAMVLLAFAAVVLAIGNAILANQFATCTCYFLVMGAALQAIEYFREGGEMMSSFFVSG